MHNTKKKTTEQFIEEAHRIHGDKYDYSKVVYKNNLTPVTIICPLHGEFEQTPKCHLNGHGCYECAKQKFGKGKRSKPTRLKEHGEHFVPNKDYLNCNIKDTESFISYCSKLHNGKYDYSKVNYKNRYKPVVIICPIHGEFEQTPYQHIMGHGCKKCGRLITSEKQKIGKEEFIRLAKKKYDNRYDYSNIDYINFDTKISIICPIHGEFEQTPKQHLKACGCKGCIGEKKREYFAMKPDEFISRSTKIHNGKYSYNNVIYVNNATDVMITCPKHGDFPCTPANHLKGRGCPLCKAEMNVYENRLFYFLKTIFNENDIVRQYRSDWLSNNKSLDFYIPKYNIAIEHQGSQHFYPVEFLGGIAKHERCVNLDKEKYEECKKNGITLLYFTYEIKKVENYIGTVYADEDRLREKIMEIINIFNDSKK